MKIVLFMALAALLQSCTQSNKSEETGTESFSQSSYEPPTPRSIPLASAPPALVPPPAVATGPSPSPASALPPTSTTSSAPTTSTPSCEDHLDLIGRSYFQGTLLSSSKATETGFFIGFESRTYERMLPAASEPFNPEVAGYSIRFRDANNNFVIPASAYISPPNSNLGSGNLSVGYGTQVRAKITFHISRGFRFPANLNNAYADLYCNGKLVGTEYSYFQAFTSPLSDPDSCKHRGGSVIANKYCHFNNSCLTADKAAQEMKYRAEAGFTSCFNFAPSVHSDCVKGYGADRGYVAACPLLNLSESKFVAPVTTTMSEIYRLYQNLRMRNPDSEGYQYWKNAIDADPSQLQTLEELLRQR